ncbi:neudesin isoform X2 [Aplysia californica]|uniref:Neudesin isoform X2 n=1 Tax=Aplysia californica TaxID=6500 RepID=A0ABM0JDV9_APLCA|nr:neudesin isoform X2 [Aplysia californica]
MSAQHFFSLFVVCILMSFSQFVHHADAGYTLKEVEVVSNNGEPVRVFTAEELKEYDGSNSDKPLYMGIKGVVFDVSKGERFYGKDAPYNVLVGIDSTRAVAKMSLEKEDLNHDISGLSESTLKSLDDVFEGTYVAKYPIAGYMDYLLEQSPEKFEKLKVWDTRGTV